MIFKEFIAEMLHNLLLELLNTTGQTFSKWDCEKAIISTASCLNSTTIICQTNEHNDTVAQLGIFFDKYPLGTISSCFTFSFMFSSVVVKFCCNVSCHN